ncbi:MAG TPA: sigma-70 family RNA polymerase sigma factor [Longimicrobiaceae bacterium]|nr:sigma-70 family RNA polymerase sigma factor [Longimicrobiaceae bacterium]
MMATGERRRAGDDHSLVRGMAAGDEPAFAALYDRWSAAVHSVALHVVGDADEAEDVVEDTFWQAWRQAAGYRPERGTVATWLLTIARSRALDRVRARKRRREEATDALPDVPAGEEADPLRGVELAELRTTVRAALDALPAEQRRALELAYFGGMSQTEIAAHTAPPLGTVKTRVRLGLAKLREALAGLSPAAAGA